MYRPAIMGLLFCVAILLGSVFGLYIDSTSKAEPEKNPDLDLGFRPLTEEEISDLEDGLRKWDCELLREVHGWDTNAKTH